MKKISKILFLLATATFTSCSTEDIKTSNTSSVAASSMIDAANALDIQTGIQINTNESSNFKMSASPTTCAVITVDKADSYPKIFNVDYGTGCTIGQITRKGKLKITVSAAIYETGSKMTIERMDDYYINGNKLEGKIEYVNTTTSPNVPQWTRTVTGGKYTNTSGQVFLNSGSYSMKQTAGVDTPFVLADNVYEMTQGEHVVTNEAGTTLTLSVVETLVKKYSCEYVSKGKLKIAGGILNGTIDYGNNNCDNSYTYTHENGLVYELKM